MEPNIFRTTFMLPEYQPKGKMRATLAGILAETELTLPGLRARRGELERAAAQSIVPQSFSAGLVKDTLGLVGEVKRRSPSQGAIRTDLDPAEQASQYARGGAAAISVLTEGPHFGGSPADLRAVSGRVAVPVLRKDFIVDEAQIIEARSLGAAAVLLIVRVLTAARLRALMACARDFGLETLVETHNAAELAAALDAGSGLIGINSRDLDTLVIDVPAAWTLLSRVPSGVIAVAESGMATEADVRRAAAAGADAVLIGTALSASADPTALARQLSGVPRVGR
jgi:indole-3-glycerol phosphate synthase